MPKESLPFEQDFILVTKPEMRVRQAMQYTPLNAAVLDIPDEDTWAWENNCLDVEQIIDKPFDEDCATVWESMLERL
jgi:hypothetical protein